MTKCKQSKPRESVGLRVGQISLRNSLVGLSLVSAGETIQIDTSRPSTQMEVIKEVSFLMRQLNFILFPSFFKHGGGLLRSMLKDSRDWFGKSSKYLEIVVSRWVHRWTRNMIGPHVRVTEKFSSIRISSQSLASIVFRRLSNAREGYTRENQVGFLPGRGFIDQLFILWQILGHRHRSRRPTITVFPDLEAMSYSVDRVVLWRCLSLEGMSEEFIPLIQSLHASNWIQVRAYDNLSPEFTMRSGFRQSCSFHFLFSMFLLEWLLR